MTAEIKSDIALPPEISKYITILSKDPGSMVFAPLAESYRKAGMLDEAIATAQDGLAKHPNYLSAMVALGRAYYEKGMLKEAQGELEQVIKIAPDNIIANNILAELSSRQEATSVEQGKKGVEVKSEEEDKSEVEASGEVMSEEAEDLLELEEVTETVAEDEAGDVEVEEISFEAEAPGLGLKARAKEEAAAAGARPPLEKVISRKEITTETIAELYIKQGYIDRAVEIYQIMLDNDPGNGEVRKKLNELKMQLSGTGAGKDMEPAAWSMEPENTEPEAEVDKNIKTMDTWLKTIQIERRKI